MLLSMCDSLMPVLIACILSFVSVCFAFFPLFCYCFYEYFYYKQYHHENDAMLSKFWGYTKKMAWWRCETRRFVQWIKLIAIKMNAINSNSSIQNELHKFGVLAIRCLTETHKTSAIWYFLAIFCSFLMNI